MFAIGGYNTAAKDNYDSLHRGFLTRTNAGYRKTKNHIECSWKSVASNLTILIT